ncbi:MAG: hypothetical protein H6671_12115 [Anaerolineaceae bacterium]|nr:hypothetical protein [Anaerolineaceae bacterium]
MVEREMPQPGWYGAFLLPQKAYCAAIADIAARWAILRVAVGWGYAAKRRVLLQKGQKDGRTSQVPGEKP